MLRDKIAGILDKAMGYRRRYPTGGTQTRDKYVDAILKAVEEELPEEMMVEIEYCDRVGGGHLNTIGTRYNPFIAQSEEKGEIYRKGFNACHDEMKERLK